MVLCAEDHLMDLYADMVLFIESIVVDLMCEGEKVNQSIVSIERQAQSIALAEDSTHFSSLV